MQGLAYTGILILASGQLWRIHSRVPNTWGAQKEFHLLVALFAVTRATQHYSRALRLVGEGSNLYFILWSMPGAFFFSTYTLLVSEWARICHQTYSEEAGRSGRWEPRKVLFAANAGFYMLQMGLFVLLFLNDPDGKYRKLFRTIEPRFFGAVALLCSAFFLVYGMRLYNMFATRLFKVRALCGAIASPSCV